MLLVASMAVLNPPQAMTPAIAPRAPIPMSVQVLLPQASGFHTATLPLLEPAAFGPWR